ncbi:MAG: response regulator [Thermodesulfobacteriota bacterium]|nr:response regulator [Thermodesulfobacteriota bacterium]
MKILLVDDEDQFRESVMRQLTNRGYTVYDVSTGEEAIELISQQNIDVTVLDMRMPGISGEVTLNEIKRIAPLTEVIMLTGHATVNAAMKVINMGAFDYITKPVRLNELINKMEDAYKKKELKEKKLNNR